MSPSFRSAYPASNPFSTFAIRPGATPYRFFDPELNASLLVQRFLHTVPRWAAIVGPHGSGKSTLLATLRSELSLYFPQSCDATPCTSLAALPNKTDANPPLMIIDGFDALSLYDQLRIQWQTFRGYKALLFTSHRTRRHIPTLIRTSVSLAEAQCLVAELLQESPELRPHFAHYLNGIWDKYSPNFREALFALYDEYERHARKNQR